MTELCHAVKQLRLDAQLTQQALSQQLGKSISTVVRWETSRAPRGKELAGLILFAKSKHLNNSVARLKKALLSELGLTGL